MMEGSIHNYTRTKAVKKCLYVCLIVFSFIPDIGIKFTTAGFTWTIYRTVIAISIVSIISLDGRIRVKKNKILSSWIVFQTIWLLYGGVLLFVGRYADFHSGFIELLSVFNGLIVFYCMSIFLREERNKDIAVKLIYLLLNFFIIFGIIEIVSEKHWITSGYFDTDSSIFQYKNKRMATGFMYNMNDFSALITCMTPVLLYKRFGRKRILSIIGVFFINIQNDATTCSFAIVIFVLFYFLIIQGGTTHRARLLKILFWVIVFATIVFIFQSQDNLTQRHDILGAAARQISNAQMSAGSLYHRIIMYRDALYALASTGMIGLGPGGFANYFLSFNSMSGLVNPHAMIIEILTQYGIIIASWYVFLLLKMFTVAKRQCTHKNNNERSLSVVAFIIIYFIASFAPSSFIGYSYQWLLIAVMCSSLDKSNIIGGICLA